MRGLPLGGDGDTGEAGLVGDVVTLVRTARALDRARLLGLLVLLLVGGTLGGASLFLLVPIVQTVAADGAFRLPLLGGIGVGSLPLWVLLGLFVGLVGLQALVGRTTTVQSARLQQRIIDRLRHDAFAAVLAARWSFVVGLRRSDVIQVITVGSARVGTAVGLLLQGGVALVLFLAGSVVALVVAPLVGAVAIVAVVAMAAVQAVGIRPAHRLGRELGERSRHLQGVVVDSLDSLRLVRAHDAAEPWVQRLADAFTATRATQLAATERTATLSALSTVGAAGAAAMLVLVSTWAGVAPAQIVVLVILLARLAGQAQSLVRTGMMLANVLPAVGEITELTAGAVAAVEALPDPTSPSSPPADAAPDPSAAALPGDVVLELRGVTYHHPSSGRGVTDLDLRVPRGRITVLTGPSGSGKSTTADLALGLLQPDAGRVVANGRALGPAELAWWRAQVAYVPQETVLVPGSLRENLTWSAGRHVADDECWAALDRAAAGFARRFADGLDSVVGDRGIRLSGGERQRVAIARALLRRPSLLVLDEATSSLDDETEAAVLDTIAALTPAVTVLVVAHRRSTVDAADQVVRLVDGRRVEPVG